MEGQYRRGCAGVRLPGQGAGLPRPGGRGHHGVLAAAGRLQGDYSLKIISIREGFKQRNNIFIHVLWIRGGSLMWKTFFF